MLDGLIGNLSAISWDGKNITVAWLESSVCGFPASIAFRSVLARQAELAPGAAAPAFTPDPTRGQG
jgi:hypothetical protein